MRSASCGTEDRPMCIMPSNNLSLGGRIFCVHDKGGGFTRQLYGVVNGRKRIHD